jgi:peptide/nickel transport system substrate-binding protein
VIRLVAGLRAAVTGKVVPLLTCAAASAVALATTVPSAPLAAASHPATLSLANPLGPGVRPNWWPPIVSSLACLTLTGGFDTPSYMPLLWVNGSGTIDWSRSIATSITVSNHDRTYTIHMGAKWRWSNGTPLTAADALFDWSLLKAGSGPKSPLPYCYAGEGGVPLEWQAVTAPNAHTLVVTTTQPVNPSWFEINGLTQIIPMPEATWNRYPTNVTKELQWINSIADQPMNPVYRVVDGPYRVQAVVANQYYRFTWNPDYTLGAPHIHTIIYDYEPSDTAEFAALRTGQIQVGTLPSQFWSARGQLTGYAIQEEPSYSFDYIAPNYSPKTPGIGNVLNQLYIRQALQYGINQPGLIQALFHGAATATLTPVPVTSALYDQAIKNPYPYNVAKGRALLEAHGWKMVNGVMTKGGKKLAFTFLFPTGSLVIAEEVQAIQATWAEEGVEVTLKGVPPTTFDAVQISPSDLGTWAVNGVNYWIYAPDYLPDGTFAFLPNAGYNMGAYSDPEMTRLIDATLAPGTSAQVQSRFDAYEVYAADSLPVLYAPTPKVLNVISDQLGGWQANYNSIREQPPLEDLYWK